MPRGLPKDQVTPIRELLRQHLDSGRLTQDEVAKAIGVSQATVSDIKNGRRGIGVKSLPALARLFGQTTDQVLGGRALAGPARVTVLDDRYPNRARALRAWRELLRDEEAAANVESLAMDRDDDPSPDEWFADLEREERRLNAGRRGKAIVPPVATDWDDAPRLPKR